MLKVFGGAITAVGATFAKLGLVGVTSGVAGLTALFGSAVKFGSVGDELDKMSKRTGVAVEELSMLKYAAIQSGSSLEEVEVTVRRMQRALIQAADVKKVVFAAGKGGISMGSQDPFSKIGMSAQALAKMDPGEAFVKLGQTLNTLDPQSSKVGEFMKVFGFHGQGGTKMIPMFMQLAKLMADAKAMGAIWTQADVDTAVKFEYAFKGLKFQLSRVVDTIGLALAPALTDLLTQTQAPLKAAMDWIRVNQQLVVSLAQVGVKAVVIAGEVFLAGSAIYAVGKAIMGIAIAFKIMAATRGFLISPFGIVLSLVTAGVAAWAYFTDAGQRSVQGLKDAFQNATEAMKQAWEGLWNALQAGNVELAGKIAFQGLLVSWLEVVDAMKKAWQEFRYSLALPMGQEIAAGTMAQVATLPTQIRQKLSANLPDWVKHNLLPKSVRYMAGLETLFPPQSSFQGVEGQLKMMEKERRDREAAGLEGPNATDPALKAARDELIRLNTQAMLERLGKSMILGKAAGLPGGAVNLAGIGEGSLGTFNPFTAQRFPDGGTKTLLEQSLEAQQRTAGAVEWIRNHPGAMVVI